MPACSYLLLGRERSVVGTPSFFTTPLVFASKDLLSKINQERQWLHKKGPWGESVEVPDFTVSYSVFLSVPTKGGAQGKQCSLD